jgi:enoyl-CoA hydratase/carnithine racemase
VSSLARARTDNVLTLTLDRPDALNAFDNDLRTELREALAEAEADDGVRCVVLEGNGPAFSAGGDIDQMKERFDKEMAAAELEANLDATAHALVRWLYDLGVPTIAKVDGIAAGMGFSLALACDIVVASDRSRFGAAFRTVGLGPDTGLSYILPRRIGTNAALELLYTGEIIDAETASDYGIVNRRVPEADVNATTAELAEDIASGPTRALVAAKELVLSNLDRNFDDALDAEAASQALLYTTEDHREGVEAFETDREPEFKGR